MQAARCPPAEWPLTMMRLPSRFQRKRQAACVCSTISADRHLRDKVVAGDRDGDAVRVHAPRHVAEARRVERAPVAAVDEQRKRRVALPPFGENRSIYCRAVEPKLHANLGAALGLGRRGRPRRRAASVENLRMLGHPGAVVVFDLVVDGHEKLPPLFRRELETFGAERSASA